MKWINKFVKPALALGLLMGLTACPDNKNNQNNPYQVYPNCANCGDLGAGQEFFRSQSKNYYGSLILNLNFVGSSIATNGINYYNSYYQSPVVSYYGPVAVTGNMQVNYNQQYGCTIPAGSYTITTLQAGQWRSAIAGGLRIQATGPVSVVMSLPQMIVQAKQYNQLGRLWTEIPQVGRIYGDMIVESVNGYNCSYNNSIRMD